MKGTIAISSRVIKEDNLNLLEEFKYALSKYTDDSNAGWYASIERDGIIYFLWADSENRPTDRYLRSLAKDGYQIPYQLD